MASRDGQPSEPDQIPSNVRRTFRFRGRVQGVGFRATTRLIARDHTVRGFVRNEPDGSVLCVVEGTPDELDRFRRAIELAMPRHIDRTEVIEASPTGEFAQFRIDHDAFR